MQISWQDGFSQVAPFDLLDSLPRKQVPQGGIPLYREQGEDIKEGEVDKESGDKELSSLATEILRDSKQAQAKKKSVKA